MHKLNVKLLKQLFKMFVHCCESSKEQYLDACSVFIYIIYGVKKSKLNYNLLQILECLKLAV